MPTVRRGPVRNAGAIEDALRAELRAVPVGVAASAEPIQSYLEVKVSVPYPPPSAPGQPAHLRTGKYKRAWAVRPRGPVLTITNTARYAAFLEFGTRYMKARPALTRARGGGGTDGRRLVRAAGRAAGEAGRRTPLVRSPR